VAGGLIEAGLIKGGRVAVMLDNRLEFVLAVLGCMRAGGVAIPLGTRLGSSEVGYIVGHAQPVIAVTMKAWASRFPLESSIARCFLVDADEPEQRFDALLVKSQSSLPELHGDDPMMIMYTSGTTGKPKGVVLTHDNFIHTCLHYLYALAIDEPQCSLLAVPATHIAGFGPLMSVTLASGGTVVLMQEFDPRQVLDTIQRERISYSVLVPAMVQLCATQADLAGYDLASWRYCIYGGAIMPPAVIERFAAAIPGLRMINAYGATETCAVCTIIPYEMTGDFPSSVGLSLQCDDIIVVDADGKKLPAGESGELWIRGPNVFREYWSDEVATSEAFCNGYWRSGDVGMKDERGLIYVQDRIKDMINRGGYKVFSAEVEAALMTHDAVVDCAVIGVPHPVLGEKTYAFVQVQGERMGSDQLKTYLQARIADYKVPDFWSIGDIPMPRNQNGKLQKAELREKALNLLKG
jgi:acyl-CoA synthetase (AMP-forming)/AMP-acid ligase II